jgi:hypothetical protein
VEWCSQAVTQKLKQLIIEYSDEESVYDALFLAIAEKPV